MDRTISEIIKFVDDNDIKFIRLQFCDILGELKNISIMSSQLERAFKYGISFDASSIKGFLDIEESDLFLYPDPSTLTILPWRPQEGRVAILKSLMGKSLREIRDIYLKKQKMNFGVKDIYLRLDQNVNSTCLKGMMKETQY